MTISIRERQSAGLVVGVLRDEEHVRRHVSSERHRKLGQSARSVARHAAAQLGEKGSRAWFAGGGGWDTPTYPCVAYSLASTLIRAVASVQPVLRSQIDP